MTNAQKANMMLTRKAIENQTEVIARMEQVLEAEKAKMVRLQKDLSSLTLIENLEQISENRARARAMKGQGI